MPKTKTSQPHLQACVASVSTESPVPGVHIEVAVLLVQAIKARRKLLSKSATLASSSSNADGEEKANQLRQCIGGLQSTADDKTAAFLNELRRRVEHSSASNKTYTRRNKPPSSSNNAPTCCLEFLLEILSNASNSFHLRRSALALSREILVRSSDARTFLASGQCLLDFVSMVESVENDHAVVEEGGEHNDEAAPSSSSNVMSPKSLFQLEAMELIHHLGIKFGRFYTQFTVASRLLGDVSVNFSMDNSLNNNDGNNGEGGGRQHSSQRVNMRILRRERDVALECGPKACQSLERMVERADQYFRVLVPRYGGFNAEPTDTHDSQISGKDSAGNDDSGDSKPTDESCGLDPYNKNDADYDDGEDDEDDDSIDWEEGEVVLSDSDHCNENSHDTSSDFHSDKPNNHSSSFDHQAAVEETMDIMGRGGALLDGKLAVQVGGSKSMELETTTMRVTDETLSNLATTTTSQPADAHAKAPRLKLQNMVQKFSTHRLPRLNRWIHALSRADGMEERQVLDPATAVNPDNKGPISLVLLSEEKRAMRGELLRRMLRVREEIEGVLRSAATLGISPEGAGNKTNDSKSSPSRAPENGNEVAASSATAVHDNVTGMKRPWKPGAEAFVAKKKKPKSSSRFKVIYRKK
ncbi:hypothetical protein ACHAXR_009354 [Thalassiosira sp. AJA248-18]